jgi:hypothetical protein
MNAIYPLFAFWLSLEVYARLEKIDPPVVATYVPPAPPIVFQEEEDDERRFFSAELIEEEGQWKGDVVEWGEW